MAKKSFTAEFAPAHDSITSIFDFQIYRYDRERDFKVINNWLSQDYASFWGMQSKDIDARKKELAETDHKFSLVGYRDRKLEFYTEIYNPLEDAIGSHYSYQHGDCGMHILLSPLPKNPEKGFSRKVMTLIMKFIFEYMDFSRVIVEPDINNRKIHPINKFVGIEYQKTVQLPTKKAKLGLVTKEDFLQTIRGKNND